MMDVNSLSGRRSRLGSLALLVCLVLGVLALALAARAAVGLIGRRAPWGQQALVRVWLSIAAPPGDAGAEVPGLPGAVTPGAGLSGREGAWPGRAWLALRQRLAQAVFEVAVDSAALWTRTESRPVVLVPYRMRLAAGDAWLSCERVGADGTVELTVAGASVRLGPGEGHDVALVALAGGGWRAEDGDWRQILLLRLSAGQAIARLSVVNEGLVSHAGRLRGPEEVPSDGDTTP